MKLLSLLVVISSFIPFVTQSSELEVHFDKFDDIYQAQLGSTRGCLEPEVGVFKVCSDTLRNDGNAPFILHHNKKATKVAVLFHGLSDSPFYLRSIGQYLYQQGFNVVVALLPGHGKKEADAHMQDPDLSDRWNAHVSEVMTFSKSLGEQVYIGGFSTGGGLATEYILQNPNSVKGLMLFSGALALDPSVESMSNIWGIQLLAKWLDGEYQTMGGNPYKYPHVARFTGFELAETIFSVRALIEQGVPVDLPIFSAHSLSDRTTPIIGIKNLMAVNQNTNTLFELPKELKVCHADVVVSRQQVIDMRYDASRLEEILPCDVPKANPKHAEMLDALGQFLTTH